MGWRTKVDRDENVLHKQTFAPKTLLECANPVCSNTFPAKALKCFCSMTCKRVVHGASARRGQQWYAYAAVLQKHGIKWTR